MTAAIVASGKIDPATTNTKRLPSEDRCDEPMKGTLGFMALALVLLDRGYLVDAVRATSNRFWATFAEQNALHFIQTLPAKSVTINFGAASQSASAAARAGVPGVVVSLICNGIV